MFRVIRLTDPAVIRTFLTMNGADDRARYAYMIGDLSSPYWDQAIFYGALDDQDVLRAVLLYYEPITPPPVISAGDPDGILAIWPVIVQAFAPPIIVYHAQPNHMAAVQRFFATPDPLPMWRMAISPDRLNTKILLSTTRRLIGTDAETVQALFDNGSPDEFMDGPPHIVPAMLDNVPFFGTFAVGQPDQLVAVAGTHILSPVEGLGAVGYVFTAPAARGHGYATQATAAVTQALFASGLDLVVLNVKQSNLPAIRAYERVGYVRQSPLFEGKAYR